MIDTHAHLHFSPLNEQPTEAILKRALENGVNKVINVGSDLAGSLASIQLAKAFPGQIYATVGVHPHDAANGLNGLETLIQEPSVVAIGECGLDYFRDLSPRDIQQQIFEAQIELAVKYQKPLIIHNREADQDVLDRLEHIDYPRIVFHCYSSSVEYAQKLLDLGFMISFTGNITFPKNIQGKEVVKYVPLDRIMVETDCPFMTPVPFRGKTNEPAYVKYVAEEIAKLKGITLEEVDKTTTENAIKFFGISIS